MAWEIFVRGEQPEVESKWLRNREFTLGEANGEAMHLAETKNLREVVNVGGEVLGEDQDIIQLDKTEQKLIQNMVNHALKSVSSIPESKGHSPSSLLLTNHMERRRPGRFQFSPWRRTQPCRKPASLDPGIKV